MVRNEIYTEATEMFGLVPTFVKSLPDSTIDQEWSLLKNIQFGETLIPNKYKELIGLGISAVTHCRYCTAFHTEAARLNGASEEEIEEAVHFAKHTAGWSSYLNGMQIDYDEFLDELSQMSAHIRASVAATPNGVLA